MPRVVVGEPTVIAALRRLSSAPTNALCEPEVWRRLAQVTTVVAVPETADGAEACSVAAAAEAVITVHLRPVVDAVRSVTRITDRFACSGCAACPELTTDERAEQLRARASAAEQAGDLPVRVRHAG